MPTVSTTWACPRGHVRGRDDVRPGPNSDRLDPAYCRRCGALCERRPPRSMRLYLPDDVHTEAQATAFLGLDDVLADELPFMASDFAGAASRPRVIVTLADMPTAAQFSLFRDLLSVTSGECGVALRLPEGDIALEAGISLTPAFGDLVAHLLPGATVAWDRATLWGEDEDE